MVLFLFWLLPTFWSPTNPLICQWYLHFWIINTAMGWFGACSVVITGLCPFFNIDDRCDEGGGMLLSIECIIHSHSLLCDIMPFTYSVLSCCSSQCWFIMNTRLQTNLKWLFSQVGWFLSRNVFTLLFACFGFDTGILALAGMSPQVLKYKAPLRLVRFSVPRCGRRYRWVAHFYQFSRFSTKCCN